jgi:hypothetical protein
VKIPEITGESIRRIQVGLGKRQLVVAGDSGLNLCLRMCENSLPGTCRAADWAECCLTRIITSFCYLINQTLFGHPINRSDSNACRCRKKETTEHLLLACPEGGDSRKKIKQDLEGINLSLKILLYTKLGIEKLLGFIETTRFATRK